MDTIIRAPKGTLRHEIKVDEIQVRDLWHVYTLLAELGYKEASEWVLETWHLAHDLITNIQADRDNITI